jgi:predicted DNA-binding transcriptional regulator AlpA
LLSGRLPGQLGILCPLIPFKIAQNHQIVILPRKRAGRRIEPSRRLPFTAQPLDPSMGRVMLCILSKSPSPRKANIKIAQSITSACARKSELSPFSLPGAFLLRQTQLRGDFVLDHKGRAVQPLLSVEELATCLHKSVASIRSDASRNPEALPPICRLPGTKRLLWRAEDVERWLAQHVSTPPQQAVAERAVEVTPRRGRPRKQ